MDNRAYVKFENLIWKLHVISVNLMVQSKSLVVVSYYHVSQKCWFEHGMCFYHKVAAIFLSLSVRQAPIQEAPNIFATMHFKPEHSYIDEEDEDDGKTKEDVFQELRRWKEQHER